MTRLQQLLLAAILLSATLLRVPRLIGIYPTTAEWDEMFLTENAEELGINNQWKPRWVYYPTMCYYPHAAALAITRAVSDWHAEHRGTYLLNLYGPYRSRDQVHLVCRTTQGLLGVVTVFLTFVAGRRLYASTSVGLWAAALLAWMPYDILRTQVIKPDGPTALWSVVALIGAIQASRQPTLRNALIGGFLVGLPVAARYNAAPAVAFPLMVALLTSSLPRRRALLYLIGAGAMSLVAFLVTNPYFLIEPEWYFDRIGYMLNGYAVNSLTRGHGFFGIIGMLLRHMPSDWLFGYLAGGLFFTTLVPMAIDVVRGSHSRFRFTPPAQSHLLVLSFALGYPLVHCAINDVFLPHLMQMMFPCAAIVAGHGAVRALSWIGRRESLRFRQIARSLAYVGSAALLYHGPSVLYHNTGTLTTRAAAMRWASEQKPTGRVLTYGMEPPLDRGWVALDQLTTADHLLDATSYILAPHQAGREALRSTGDSAIRDVLRDPRVQLSGPIAADWPTIYGDTVAVFRVVPKDADLVIARVSLIGAGVWTMNGAPYVGKRQSDGVWTVDPFLRDWGATDLSLQLADALPTVTGASLDIAIDVFCRSPECVPSLRVQLGDQDHSIDLCCDQSWHTYTIAGLHWDDLIDSWIVIEPPQLGPEILLVGSVELKLSKPLAMTSIEDAMVAGTLAAGQLGRPGEGN